MLPLVASCVALLALLGSAGAETRLPAAARRRAAATCDPLRCAHKPCRLHRNLLTPRPTFYPWVESRDSLE